MENPPVVDTIFTDGSKINVHVEAGIFFDNFGLNSSFKLPDYRKTEILGILKALN